jgi:hypothetical protein
MTGICAKETAGVDVKRTFLFRSWMFQLGGKRTQEVRGDISGEDRRKTALTPPAGRP